MANVKPLRDRILVKRLEESEQKMGGFTYVPGDKSCRKQPTPDPPRLIVVSYA